MELLHCEGEMQLIIIIIFLNEMNLKNKKT